MERYNQMVNDITNFTQAEGETICAAWNRFKDIMRRCRHYPVTNGDQVRIFFNGCKPEIRMVLNGAAGGSIKSMRTNETLELIERMAANENEGLTAKPKRGIIHLDNNDAVLAENKLLSQQKANLTSRLDKMQLSSVQAQAASVVCEYCKDNHESNECPSLLSADPSQQVHVNGVWYDQRPPPQNVPRNQNFPSGNNNFQRRVQGTDLDFKSNNYLQPPPVQPMEPSDLEKLVGQMAQHSNAFMEETRANTRNTQASIRNLENQIGQIAKQMAKRAPAPTKPNTNVEANEKVKEPEKEVVIPSDVEKPVQKGKEEELPIIAEKKKFELNPEYVRAMAPYPERFKKDAQKQQYARFLDIFKKLHVNIPFIKALANMPNYAKFMKDLLSRKHKLQECQTVTLTEEWRFNIPIAIGDTDVGKALCDLGASINLMPLSVYKSLGISELKPTKVSLQLADKSFRKPSGIIEDVLVKVDKFIFPADFMVLDMKGGTEMPLSLELKELPETLQYTFLGNKEAVIEVLKEHETAIGWSISDLKDKDPSSCTHKILNKDDDKNMRKPQGRYHSTMKKVMRKEVVKLFDTGWRMCADHRKLKATKRRIFDKRHRDSISQKNQYFKEFLTWLHGLNEIWE
ncbi:uncharacterized protein LOC133294627 [Gastrolobium bilobum]|uniref:uncharacterized protein LOC133294627 n=1 Tax=Gastrolobium bilobum TaxID=150636 RepID=UPI002AB2C837|nr:uncharacterized protein LOC133294627 [Gastrolobium bilobum]